MTIFKKLQDARITLQNTKLKKSGHNKFAGYNYFELSDFLPAIQEICYERGMCGTVSFTADTAYLTIYDVDDGTFLTFTSPMSSAALKGCHDVQNLGAVQTYLRRYLWVNAFEIVEHDALEPLTGKEEPLKKDKPVKTYAGGKPNHVTKPESNADWLLTVDLPFGTPQWVEAIAGGTRAALALANSEDDVANIFKNNRVSFDEIKEKDEVVYAELMAEFKKSKSTFTKE
jgi:hypothetical protein